MSTRLAAASDNVYQFLAHWRLLTPGTPASSITKTGRHDIAEILLKVTLGTINQPIFTFKIILTSTSRKLSTFRVFKSNISYSHAYIFCGIRVARLFSFLCCPIMCLYVLSSVWWSPLRFRLYFQFVCRRAHVLFMLFVFVWV